MKENPFFQLRDKLTNSTLIHLDNEYDGLATLGVSADFNKAYLSLGRYPYIYLATTDEKASYFVRYIKKVARMGEGKYRIECCSANGERHLFELYCN